MTSSDAFALLGLPRRFGLSATEIQRAYLARVSRIHPDVSGVEDPQVSSAELNLARAVLSDPERRANELLRLLGGPAKEADKSLPPRFLMEIMETREAVEAARGSGDAAEVEKWRAWAASERGRFAQRVGEMFEAVSREASEEALGSLRQTLNAWRYIERLIEQLDPAYDPNRADFPGV
jgi:molecular chaperone HscB